MKSLYVSRKVLNHEDLRKWAQQEGFPSIMDPEEFHVTLVFVVESVDITSFRPNDAHHDMLGDPHRTLEAFGQSVSLTLNDVSLVLRHKEIIQQVGASRQKLEYRPHVALTYVRSDNWHEFTPYYGPIHLGPEIISEVDLNWTVIEVTP